MARPDVIDETFIASQMYGRVVQYVECLNWWSLESALDCGGGLCICRGIP